VTGVTVPIDLLLSVLFGGAVALASRGQLKVSSRPWYASRYFVATLAFHALVVLPAAAYRYVFHTDWAFMYFFDGSSLDGALVPAGLLLLLAASVGGFAIGTSCARTDRLWLLLTVMAACMGGIALVATLGARRLLSVGSTTEWDGGFGLSPITSTDLLPAIVVMGLCVLAGWISLLAFFAHEGETS